MCTFSYVMISIYINVRFNLRYAIACFSMLPVYLCIGGVYAKLTRLMGVIWTRVQVFFWAGVQVFFWTIVQLLPTSG